MVLDPNFQPLPVERINLHSVVDVRYEKHRLDRVAAALFSHFSRSRIQKWIKNGELMVDGNTCHADYRLKGGETLSIDVEQMPEGDWLAQEIPIDVVHEDNDLIVLNKPKDLVVHPGAGNFSGTLLNGLLFKWPQLSLLPRAGIVHRLDKDTSGLMVVAKTLFTYSFLVNQLQTRQVKREYESVVHGRIAKSGFIDEPIGRHPKIRTKMAVVENGRRAITHFRAINYLGDYTHLRLQLETGRTHQIRVHMAHINHPIVGDFTYGRKTSSFNKMGEIEKSTSCFPRQALHAIALGLKHPNSGISMEWTTKLPRDMTDLLQVLQSGGNGD